MNILPKIATISLGFLLFGCAVAPQNRPSPQIPQQQSAFDRGVALYNQENYKEASVAFKEALTVSPSNAAYSSWLGASYCRGDNPTLGIDIFTRLINASPNDPSNFDWLGHCYNAVKKYDDAIVAAKRALQLNPNYADAYYLMGLSYTQKHQQAEAYDMFRQTLTLNPNHAKAHFELAKAYAQKGDLLKSTQFFEKAHALDPNNSSIIESLAELYYGTQNYQKALETISKAISRDAIIGLGINLDMVDGKVIIQNVFNNTPAHKAGLAINDIIYKVNDEDMTGKTIAYVVSKTKGAEETTVHLIVQRNDKMIDKTLTRELILNPKVASKIELRSLIFRKINQENQALKDAEALHTFNASMGNTALGALSIDKNAYAEAIAYLTLVKNNALASTFEALAYAKSGATDKAKALYKKLLKEESFNETLFLMGDRKILLSALAPVIQELERQANTYEKEKNYLRALDVYKEMYSFASTEEQENQLRNKMLLVIQKMGKMPEVSEEAHRHIIRAELMVKEGNYVLAINEFHKAINEAPYSALLYFNVALLEAQTLNYTQAIRMMKIYTQMAPQAPNNRLAKDEIIKWEMLIEQKKEVIAEPQQSTQIPAINNQLLNERRNVQRGTVTRP